MKRLYLAAPLFSTAEREFNRRIKTSLSDYFDVFLPQEDGGLLVEMVKEGVSLADATRRVFEIDVAALEWCDCVLILLDGRTVDEGAAFELGYAFARGKRCFAIQTDPRRLLLDRNNPMIDAAVEATFRTVEDLIRWAASEGRAKPLLDTAREARRVKI